MASQRYLDINGKRFTVELKTPDWGHLIEEEVAYGIDNSVPLIEHRTHFNIDELDEYDIGTGSRSTSPDSPIEPELASQFSGPLPSRPPPPTMTATQAPLMMSSPPAQVKPMRPAPPPPRPGAPPSRPQLPAQAPEARSLLDTSIPHNEEEDHRQGLNETLDTSTASIDSKETSFKMPPPSLPPPNLPKVPPTKPQHINNEDDEEEEEDEEEDYESAPPPSFAPPPAFAPPTSAPPPLPVGAPPTVPNGPPPPVPARRPPPSVPPRNL